MTSGVQSISIKRWTDSGLTDRPDLVAVEEPLEIRLGFGDEEREQRSLSVTMRTPGHDFELALGFLFTEKIISSAADVASVVHCENVALEEKGNVVRVELTRGVKVNWAHVQRNFYTTSS